RGRAAFVMVRPITQTPDSNAIFRAGSCRKAGVFMNRMLGIVAGFTLGAFAALPAAAQPAADGNAAPATLLGVYNNWATFQSGSGASLTCYAISKPRASRPRGAKRSAIYLMVSTWPARKVKAEPQIVYGYP